MATHKVLGLRSFASVAVLLYAVSLLGWAFARWLLGDQFWLLGLLNAFAVYLFAPLPLLALLTLLARRGLVWLALLLVALLFLGLFGADLVPPSALVSAGGSDPALTVMTYNVLFTHTDAAPVAAVVRQAAPDVVAFQELTMPMADGLVRELGERYPYRTPLRPGCFAEVAIWSRYPLLRVESVEEDMACRVRSAVLDVSGHPVRVVGVHGWPYTGLDRESVEQGFRWRREQIQAVLDQVDGQPEPLVLLGDLNSTPMHEVYAMLSARLTDSFREAGWGLGHTFPAEGGCLRDLLPYPARLLRIDYVFHSSDWRAEAAWVAGGEGVSDHLPVVARLRLHAPGATSTAAE